MMSYEGNGDGVAISTENHNENYISLESSPFHEDSKSRVCYTFFFTYLAFDSVAFRFLS